MATTREVFTQFGQVAIAYWDDTHFISDTNCITCSIDVTFFDNGAGWDGSPVVVCDMLTESEFSFDVDPSGRWWICFTDNLGVLYQYYSDNSGSSWLKYGG